MACKGGFPMSHNFYVRMQLPVCQKKVQCNPIYGHLGNTVTSLFTITFS